MAVSPVHAHFDHFEEGVCHLQGTQVGMITVPHRGTDETAVFLVGELLADGNPQRRQYYGYLSAAVYLVHITASYSQLPSEMTVVPLSTAWGHAE